MKNKSKDIQNEINNIIELVLYLDKNISNLNEKEKELKLSENSKDIIKEITESKKATNYFCNDEKIKKTRNSIGIISSMLSKNKFHNMDFSKMVNPISFNQGSLQLNSFYYGAEGEFYFIKKIIKSKILEIVKSCFEHKFNQNEKEKINKKTRNRNNSLENKNGFILISYNNLQKAKIRSKYFNSFFNNNISNINNNYSILSMKNFFLNYKTSNSNFFDSKNSSYINIFDNSKNINNSNYNNNYNLFKSNSCINLMDNPLNKNTSLTNNKFTSANLKFSTINNSIVNRNKSNKTYKKRNIILLNKKKVNEVEKSFMPLLNIHDFKYKSEVRFKPKKIPSFSSEIMELIHYNTKNNIKAKAEEEFLNECLRETYRSLRKINNFGSSKCFVDYSKNNIHRDNNDVSRKMYELPSKEKKYFYGFEYKNIFRYSFDGNFKRIKK